MAADRPDDAAGTVAAKRALRRRMRVVRAAIAADADERARRSAAICADVVALLTSRFGERRQTLHLLLYEPLAGEPDVTALMTWCSTNGHRTYLPAVVGTELVVGQGDRDAGGLDPHDLDVVIVPGLAFSPQGRRLGQGGGHFDRFLAELTGHTLLIGVAFTEHLVDAVPVDAHDVSVDAVITG